MTYITRIAPSPTGDFHIGTARTAYFNWLAARVTNGKFFVRIDDTDDIRNKEECVQAIYDTLSWLGLNWDETFRQSDRQDLYNDIAHKLYLAGFATILSENGAIALKWQDHCYPRSWIDEVVGNVAISDDDAKKTDGIILIRGIEKGSTATYHFASVVDDYLSGVNYIIRGSDHITNTSRQVAIWSAISQVLDYKRELPKFAHVGLLFHNGKKISKRDGAASCLSYKEKGVHPEALLNFLLRLGWSPTKDDKSTALLPKEKALELFLTGGKMRAANPNTDFIKLDSFDRKYKGRDEKNQKYSTNSIDVECKK